MRWLSGALRKRSTAFDMAKMGVGFSDRTFATKKIKTFGFVLTIFPFSDRINLSFGEEARRGHAIEALLEFRPRSACAVFYPF